MRPLLLLCDRHIPLPDLPETIRVTRYDPLDGLPRDAGEYDALLIRTVSPVTPATLHPPFSRLRFIGTATAGTDHVNREWLREQGIEFASSPGCNASAVGEYVATAVLLWSLESGTDLSTLRAGIVGAGHTGRAAARLLQRLGITCLLHDPPRSLKDPDFTSASLEELLGCDLISLHLPLERSGPWPTRHWLDAEKLEGGFRLVLNASRGGTLDEAALLEAKARGRVGEFILDVWEEEPQFRDRSAREAFLATPHIAGYSIQSKERATTIVLDSLFRFFGMDSPSHYHFGNRGQGFPKPSPEGVELSRQWHERSANITSPASAGGSPQDLKLQDLIRSIHPIGEYDRALRRLIGVNPEEKGRGFQRIRSDHPLRNEYPFVELDPSVAGAWPELRALGLRPGKGGPHWPW